MKLGRYGAVSCISQASLRNLVSVKLPKKVKPEMLVEETVKCKSTGTRSSMMLRAARRLHMNPEESGQAVGDPNGTVISPTVAEGVGYARSSDDNRKGKTGRSEGALL